MTRLRYVACNKKAYLHRTRNAKPMLNKQTHIKSHLPPLSCSFLPLWHKGYRQRGSLHHCYFHHPADNGFPGLGINPLLCDILL